MSEAQSPTRIPGAVYAEDVLQPGCMICAATIPERQAKFRSKVCSDDCRKALRKVRQTPGLLRTTTLHCQVCRSPIPATTAQKLGVVCGDICRNEMRRYRFQVLKNQKCPHCLHPSTPAEWEEYRTWRASRGPLQKSMGQAAARQASRGNLVWKREKALREMLRAAVAALRNELEVIIASHAIRSMEGLQAPPELSPEGEALALPLRKIISDAETLLALPKKPVDMNAAE
jgi:predicted nucleic acid-binding Zn ribbon protein